ncbi:hypothetical protein L484_013974 [Morus notabilis]|uniref:DUF599 domain-containing protein n=1 Tax=Morus notabilis TaxID=981085 RepID=W9RG53_9ROSA|nr:uncharacterized protein LOC21397133 [Morus notabilis]EXB54248.1 hypothetical protein L484_013974 [Morus notabilis]
MGLVVYLDTVLIPLSFFLTVGYHGYLWHNFKNKPSRTTFGINALKRRAWFLDLKDGNDKKSMLVVQSLRNTLMATILTASISILVVISLATLINNAYTAAHLFSSPLFGSQSTKIFALKYGSIAVFSSLSFVFGSMAIAFLIDANFLINSNSEEFSLYNNEHRQTIFEKGFVLALVSNRLLCISFPLLLWMLGPVPVWLSSLALVWGLYQLDFAAKVIPNCCNKQT